VSLPNANKILVNLVGTIKFFEFLELNDMLYIPSFSINLIFISNELVLLFFIFQIIFSITKIQRPDDIVERVKIYYDF